MKTLSEAGPHSHKYLRLAKHFREQVSSGALKPGDRLPSFAQMQAEHGIGQGTLERAYSLLEDEKVIIREPKRGTFVAEFKNRRSLGVIAVASGVPPKENPYYMHLLEGIQHVAFQAKVEILLLHDVSSAKLEKMDGVISTGQDIRVPPTMPCVSLVRPMNGMACVMADDFGGAKAATEHLISLGHRRIATLLLGGRRPGEHVVQQRLAGYYDALSEAGIAVNRRWIRPLRDAWEVMTAFSELGRVKMERWLKEDWAELGCTAILAHNDETAIGVMGAFENAGVHVPDEVSVIGFDGTETADHVRPRLTTVAVPLHEIGATGMQLLLRLVNQEIDDLEGSIGPLREVLPTQLKVQDSTGRVCGEGL